MPSKDCMWCHGTGMIEGAVWERWECSECPPAAVEVEHTWSVGDLVRCVETDEVRAITRIDRVGGHIFADVMLAPTLREVWYLHLGPDFFVPA